MKRNNDGFTLVELLVTIAASSIVMLAAASLLMLGVRVQRAAQEDAGEQQMVRIVLTMLENISASGRIYRVEPLSDGWQLLGKDADADDKPGPVLLRYGSGELTSGNSGENVLLDGLRAARVELDDGGLLTFTFQTEAHSYSTSIFCRTGVLGDSAGSAETLDKVTDPEKKDALLPATSDYLTDAEKAARYAFLQTLAAQYGSTGQIMNPTDGYRYYSQWYINGYENDPRWNEDTPWCACFLSWAAAQQAASLNSEPPRFADVDDGMAYFKGYQNPAEPGQGFWADGGSSYTPIPGDYIFFDWSGGSDPDHAGAVLCVEDGKVYTIEGNSGGRVAVHSYSLSDPRIVGYGILDWNKGTETTE